MKKLRCFLLLVLGFFSFSLYGAADLHNNANSRLFTALFMNNLEMVRKALDDKINPADPNKSGFLPGYGMVTPLVVAAAIGNIDIVSLLIRKGAFISLQDPLRAAPLIFVARKGSPALLALLIANGADINAQDELGATALIYAAKEGREDIVELLLKAGADRDIKDVDGNKAINFALEKKYFGIAHLLSHEPMAAGAA